MKKQLSPWSWSMLLWFACFIPLMCGAGASSEANAQEVSFTVSDEESGPEHGKINTADATPVDPGHFEFEPSYTFSQARNYWDNGKDERKRGLLREQTIGLSLTAGIIENVDVNITGGYQWVKDNDNDYDADDSILGPTTGDGFGDLELSCRYRFFESKEKSLDLAYIAGVTIPTGSDASSEETGVSQEYWSFSQMIAASKDWGKWTTSADIGYALPLGNKRGDARGTMNADVALGYQVRPWLQPELELNYSYDFYTNENDAQMLAITAGLVMPIDEKYRVNVGVQQGVWGQNTDKATAFILAVKRTF